MTILKPLVTSLLLSGIIFSIEGRAVRVLLDGLRQKVRFQEGVNLVSPSGSSQEKEFAVAPQLRIRLGHFSYVTSMAFSPNGQLLATGCNDHLVRLWDVSTDRELRRFIGHSLEITSVAFSRDAQRLITASKDGTVRIWDLFTGRSLKTITIGVKFSLEMATLSPDGTKAAAQTLIEPNAHIFDIERGAEIRTLRNTDRSVAFSSTGELIATFAGSIVRVWRLSNADPIVELKGHSKRVSTITFLANDTEILTSSVDRTIRVWDVESGESKSQFGGLTRSPKQIVVASSNDRIAIRYGLGGSVNMREFLTGKELPSLRNGEDAVNWVESFAFSPDGKRLAVAASDRLLRFWYVATQRQIDQLEGSAGSVETVAFAPNSKIIASGGADGIGTLWDSTTGRPTARLVGHKDAIRAIAFSPNGRYVATASGDKTARIWNSTSGAFIRELRGHVDSLTAIAFSQDSTTLLTGSEDETARLWQVDTGAQVKVLEGHSFPVTAVAFANGGRMAITDTINAEYSWNLESGTRSQLNEHHGGYAVTTSPDGKTALTSGGDSDGVSDSAILWDVHTGRIIRSLTGHSAVVVAVAFSPDGKMALTGSADSTARLWNVENGAEIREYAGNASSVLSVGFSLDGKFVLTGGSDCTTRIWRTNSEIEMVSLISFVDGGWVIVTPEGRFDTNNSERIEGLHWVMPDDPLTPLPVEIFMRPYYEPRLLSRLVADDDFREVPQLGGINRIQPKVTITDVKKEGDTGATLTVEVENVQHTYQREKNPVVESGAKDLRLFRDGQLVNYRDGDLLGKDQATTGCELVAGSAPKKCRAVFEHVRLPQQENVNDVEFSAYAFNTSDIKSETSRFRLKFKRDLSPRKGRVYLITVGVSSYQNSDWNLGFAANDAHLVDETVAAKLRATGDYDDVVNVMLTSEERVVNGQREIVKGATKENFGKIMRLLAGEKFPESEIREIPNAQKLEKATPEDVVLIFYSSHGYRDTERFYLFPYDTGAGQGRDPEAVVPHAISSDDLYQWLRDVAAGDVVLVIDACHAAAVTGNQFKPGPMSSRGMGQLAYDKGMRILAATQPDTTAAEVDSLDQKHKIQHGLLTYALVEDGLINQLADTNTDKVILLPEWLEYGVTDVPRLYAEAAGSQPASADRAPSLQPGSNRLRFTSKGEGDISTQQPSLFDFTQKIRRQRQRSVSRTGSGPN
jgi:WD40 repeat protein